MTFIKRMVGAAQLKPALYEEVEADKTATGQAMGVVLLQSLAAGIGTAGFGLSGLLIGAVGALVAWYVWAYLNYFIGAKVFPEAGTKADHGELLRTMGFAATPGLLRVLAVLPIPYIWGTVFLITSIWMFVAMIIAVRQALDYESTVRALAVSVLGWLIQLTALALLVGLLPNTARGL